MTSQLGETVRAALIEELELFHTQLKETTDLVSEEHFWLKPIEPGNSLGHLVLHLVGNLNFFVGAHLGKTGYVRDREREFGETNVPSKDEAMHQLDETITMFREVVSQLSEEELIADHPEERLGSVTKALVHLVAHFALHRGQMSYIQRILASK